MMMNSVLDLPRSPAELEAPDDGIIESYLQQVSSTRDVTGTNLPGGEVNFQFSTSGNDRWIPNKSYFRIRLKMKRGDADAVQMDRNWGPNMNWAGAMWKSCNVYMNNKRVSSVTDFMPQVDTLKKRLTRSKAQLDGEDSQLWFQPELNTRQNLISADGYTREKSSRMSQILPYGTVATGGYGFADPTTLACTAASPTVFTVSTGSLLTTNPVQPGDEFVVTEADSNFALGDRFRVTDILTSTTFEAEIINGITNVKAAATMDKFAFYRYQNVSPHRTGLEAIWCPPNGIFDIPNALPCCDVKIALSPHNTSDWMKWMIESIASDIAQGSTSADISISVQDIYFYAYMVKTEPFSEGTYYLSINDINCLTDVVDNTTGLQKKSFDISPSNRGLAVAFQDSSSTAPNTLYPATKFKIRRGFNVATDNTKYDSGEEALKDFYIQYNGQLKPNPPLENDYKTTDSTFGGSDYMTNLYMDSAIASGQTWNNGSFESKRDWLQRGLFYYNTWPRSQSSNSTRAVVNFSFQSQLASDVGQVLLFDFFSSVVEVVVRDGRTVSIREELA